MPQQRGHRATATINVDYEMRGSADSKVVVAALDHLINDDVADPALLGNLVLGLPASDFGFD